MVEGETVLAWLFEGDPARVRIEIALPWVVAMEALLSRGGPIEIDHPLALVSISLGGLLHLSTIAIFFVGWLVVGGLSRASRRYWLRLAGLYALLGTVAFVSIQPAGVPLLDLDAVIPAIVWAAIWLLLSWTRMAMAGALLGVGSVVGGALLGQDWMQAVAVLSLAAVGLSTVGRRLVDATDVWPGPGLQPLPGRLAAAPMRLKPAVLSLSALALLVGLGSLVGAAMGSQLGSRFGFDGLIVSELISGNLAFVMFAIAGLVVVGAVLFAIPRDAPIPMCDVRLAVAFLFSVLVPPASVAWAGIGMPTWLVTLLLVGLAVTGRNEVMAAEIPESGTVGGSDREGYGRRERGSLLAEAVNRELAMNRLDETDAGVSTGAASLADVDTARAAVVDRHPTDVTGQFLARGVHGHWFENARLSAWVGGLLALIPLAGFVWGAAESAPDQLSWNGLLYLVLGVLTEYAGWVVAAFAFGALYAFLPGRLGPVKGACLAGIWAASALLTELLSRWVTDDASDTWLFVSLRMFLFLVAVGSSVDFLTVKAAGGTYRRLADIYRVSTHKRWFAYIGPLVLAVVALIQQVSAGANADTAEAVINSVSRLLGG